MTRKHPTAHSDPNLGMPQIHWYSTARSPGVSTLPGSVFVSSVHACVVSCVGAAVESWTPKVKEAKVSNETFPILHKERMKIER